MSDMILIKELTNRSESRGNGTKRKKEGKQINEKQERKEKVSTVIYRILKFVLTGM